MATIVGTPTVATNSTTSYGTAYGTNPTAGNLLIVMAQFRAIGGEITGVSATGSNNGSFSVAQAGTNNAANIFYKQNCAGGAETVTLAFSSTGNTTSYIQLMEVSGIATSSALDQSLDSTYAGAPADPFLYPCGAGITTTGAGIIVSCLGASGAFPKSAASGFPKLSYTPADPARIAAQYKISTGAESVTAPFDGDSAWDYVHVIANFLDAVGGSPITNGPALVSVRSNIRFN